MADDDLTHDVVETFRETLGPELEYLADGLAPAVTGLVGRQVERAIDAREHRAQQAKAAEAATTAVMKTFGEQHPDWKDHEPAMLQLAERIAPQRGMDEVEWLDFLYKRVTHASWEKERDAQIAEAAHTARADDARAVGDRTTSPRSFEECFRAARRGERFDAERSTEETPRATERQTARSEPMSLRDAFALAKAGKRVGE